MDDRKRARIAEEQRLLAERRQKAIVSLAHCLGRSDVMRLHHDALIHEMLETGEEFTNAKKLRFAAYVCYWFAGLATVVERYQQLVKAGTLAPSDELNALISTDFLDILKPFRNAVAHCSDHDDDRVLELMNNPNTIPDRGTAIAAAFKIYFESHSTRPIYGAA